MFDHSWIADLDDASLVCEALAGCRDDLVEVETRRLVLAAQWLDVNASAEESDAGGAASGRPGGVLPGTERSVRVGADGTPDVGEFACAEFAALLDRHPTVGANLLAKVANLRHRHPLLWRRVLAGQVSGWKALGVARLAGRVELDLDLAQARWIDAQTFEWIDTLPWGQFLELVEARVIACDPEAAPFVKPVRIDPARLLLKATLYVHVTELGLATGAGVGRIEGVGRVTIGQIRDYLPGCQVTATRVVDLADQRPVDGYEFPANTREAVHLISPRDVFPFAASTSRRVDIDHPVPYLSPDEGGPPGQTRTGNAAPLTRFHHRIKTHSPWRLRQIEPGVYLWRSPHGWYWLTDPTGTHRLTRYTGQTLWDALAQQHTDAA